MSPNDDHIFLSNFLDATSIYPPSSACVCPSPLILSNFFYYSTISLLPPNPFLWHSFNVILINDLDLELFQASLFDTT